MQHVGSHGEEPRSNMHSKDLPGGHTGYFGPAEAEEGLTNDYKGPRMSCCSSWALKS